MVERILAGITRCEQLLREGTKVRRKIAAGPFETEVVEPKKTDGYAHVTLREHPFVKHVMVSGTRGQPTDVSILSDTTHPIEIKKEMLPALRANGYSITTWS